MSKIEERVKNSHKNSEYYKDQGSDIFYAEVNGEYTESQVSLLEYYFLIKLNFQKVEVQNMKQEWKRLFNHFLFQ